MHLPPNSTVVNTRLWGKDPHSQEVIWAQEYWNKEFRLHLLAQIEITGGLSRDRRLHNETLNELTRILPKMVAVVERDGKLEIPELFWDALLDKIGTDAAAPLWENFLRLNEEWLIERQEATLDERVGAIQVTRKLIDRDEFTAVLDRNQAFMEDHLANHLDAFRTKLLHEAQEAVEKQATKILESSPAYRVAHGQISTLALTNLLVNINNALHDVNWFTRATGATVDPRYTSRTKDTLKSGNWVQWLYATLIPAAPNSPPFPPVMATLNWDEATQCWCSGVSRGETAAGQLAMKLGRTISPDQLYIEHVPARATRDIAAAPKEFEVWARMNSTAEAKRVHDVMSQGKFPAYHPERCGKPPRGETDWVCLTHDRYNIHHHNHVQSFDLPHTYPLNMTTNHVVVRARTNWGADHTCFYRIRLTGEEVDEDYEVRRAANKPIEWDTRPNGPNIVIGGGDGWTY
jgi:hypothetical protein